MHRNRFIFFAITAVTMLGSASLFAIEYPYMYRSAYFLGRGDTGIAIADDQEAIFYNPAGVATGTGIFKKIVLEDIMLELSKDSRDVANQISLQKSSPTETLRKHLGIPQHFGANFFAGIILRQAAIGVFGHDSTSTMLYKDPGEGRSLESISAHSVSDGGVTFSLARKFFDHVYVGITAKFLKRLQASIDLNATETSRLEELKDSDRFAMLGTGGGADLGFMYRLPGRSPLSFGLTINDVGGTSFTPDNATELPAEEWPLQPIEQTVNVGFAIEPGTRLSKIRLLADYRDILDATKQDATKKVHIGTELTVLDVIGFTGGLNQGYPTAGFYLDTKLLRLDIGGYTEELGDSPGSRPDQRFYFSLACGF